MKMVHVLYPPLFLSKTVNVLHAIIKSKRYINGRKHTKKVTYMKIKVESSLYRFMYSDLLFTTALFFIKKSYFSYIKKF